MNLYLLTRIGYYSYNDYDSLVVSAVDEESARLIHPAGKEYKWDEEKNCWMYPSGGQMFSNGGWVPPSQIDVELIGEAILDKKEIICASFNAG